jgi:hypothetical protein
MLVDSFFDLLSYKKALSPLFVKVWRMHRLLTVGVQRTSLNHFQAFLLTIPLMFMEIIILTTFSLIDPPQQVERLGVGSSTNYDSNDNNSHSSIDHSNVYQQVTCEQQTNAFFITQFAFSGM